MSEFPTRVVWADPVRRVAHTLIFIGAAPPHIKAAIQALLADTTTERDIERLREAYGASFKRLFTPVAVSWERPIAGGAPELSVEELLASDTGADEAAASIERPSFAPGRITPIYDYFVFPDDNPMDVRRKIFSLTGIPIYRQHISYVAGPEEAPLVPYSVEIADVGPIPIDFRDMARRDFLVYDFPVDKALYAAREDTKVVALDNVLPVSKSGASIFYVVDIASFIDRNLAALRGAIGDRYQFDLVYYGFVIKYFPLLAPECFHSIIMNEAEMGSKYPDLAPQRAAVSSAVLEAQRIAIENRAAAAKASAAPEAQGLDYVITRVAAAPAAIGAPVNIRNLFDLLECSAAIPEIRARVEYSGVPYMLRKIHRSRPLIGDTGTKFPNVLAKDVGLVAHLSGTTFIHVLPTGKYVVHLEWREDDNATFENLASRAKEHSKKFAEVVRPFASAIFPAWAAASAWPIIGADNIVYSALNVVVRWRRILTSAEYRALRDILAGRYVQAGILLQRSTVGAAAEDLEFTFTRGITTMDASLLERKIMAAGLTSNNYYSYMSNPAVRQMWLQNYAGRPAKMTHRATDIRLDITGIYEDEFRVFLEYFTALFHAFSGRAAARENVVERRKLDTTARLKRLREMDPELYDLRRYGSRGNYGRMCQKAHQPTVYAPSETPPAGAVKFWNFTLRRPAHYSCRNPNYPYLGFIKGHPKGYCLPCCMKRKPQARSLREKQFAACTADHSFPAAGGGGGAASAYVIAYGKDLTPGRMSYLPASYLADILDKVCARFGTQMLICGVSQDHGLGIVHALRGALNMSLAAFVEGLVGAVEKAKGGLEYEMIAAGRAATYFTSKREFVGFLASLAGGGVIPPDAGDFMRVVISDCAVAAFGVAPIFVVDQSRDPLRSSLRLVRPDTGDLKQGGIGHCLIMTDSKYRALNPIFEVDPQLLPKPSAITERRLRPELIDVFAGLFRPTARISKVSMDGPDFDVIAGILPPGAIIRAFVGTRGLSYALLVNHPPGRYCYLPIVFSRPKQVPLSFEPFRPAAGEHEVSRENCEALIAHVNSALGGEVLVVIREYLQVGEAVVAAATNVGLMYFKAVAAGSSFGAPIRRLRFDPLELAAATIAEHNSGAESPLAAQIANLAKGHILDYYQYDLFCLEFAHHIFAQRNRAVREKIAAIAKDIPTRGKPTAAERNRAITERARRLRELLGPSAVPSVVAVIAERPNDIDTRQFPFDRADFDKLVATGTVDDIRKEILRMAPLFVEEGHSAAETVRMPNILRPCAGGADSEYCSSARKLRMTMDLNVAADILAHDLKNPMRRLVIMTRGIADTCRNYFDFIKRPSEVIVIEAVGVGQYEY